MSTLPIDTRSEADKVVDQALREAPPQTKKIVPEYGKTYLKSVPTGRASKDKDGNRVPEMVSEAFAIDRRHRKEIESDFRALMGRRPTKKELKALLKQRAANHAKLIGMWREKEAKAIAAPAADSEEAA